LITACSDPIFYTISWEVEPKEPLIKGSPTNFALFNDAVYVASGNGLWKYDKAKKWKKNNLGENILQIASTADFLYVLCFEDTTSDIKTTIKQMDASGTLTNVSVDTGAYINIQNIYSVSDTLFISASAATSYAVFYYNNSGQGQLALGELSGAASNGTDYFICTKQGGIFCIDGGTFTSVPVPLPEGTNETFMGIISLEDDAAAATIVSIARNGVLYSVNNTGASKLVVSFNGRLATGALAIYRVNDEPKLLLAGRQDLLGYTVDSGYTYGYLEVELDVTGIKTGSNFIEPGESSPSSIYGENALFKTTIGKYPVNSIFQTPYEIDNEMTLFASTQKNGVWSYRDIDGKWQWNAETE